MLSSVSPPCALAMVLGSLHQLWVVLGILLVPSITQLLPAPCIVLWLGYFLRKKTVFLSLFCPLTWGGDGSAPKTRRVESVASTAELLWLQLHVVGRAGGWQPRVCIFSCLPVVAHLLHLCFSRSACHLLSHQFLLLARRPTQSAPTPFCGGRRLPLALYEGHIGTAFVRVVSALCHNTFLRAFKPSKQVAGGSVHLQTGGI